VVPVAVRKHVAETRKRFPTSTADDLNVKFAAVSAVGDSGRVQGLRAARQHYSNFSVRQQNVVVANGFR
jgi:hypothetical protein